MHPICRFMDANPDACRSQAQHAYPCWEPPFNYFNAKPAHLSPLPPPPPQPYFVGAYPPYAGVYPAFYPPPPPYFYPPDPNRGCCYYYGWPNHSCRDREEDASKIEEKAGSRPAYPYAMAWHHPPQMKDGDDGSSALMQWPAWFHPMSVKNDDANAKPVGPPSESSNTGIPSDVSGVESSADEFGKINQYQPFPFPLIWMPNSGRSKEPDARARTSEEIPSKVKIIPIKYHADDGRDDEPAEKKEEERKERKEEVSRGKPPRLPPVCLRVEPLPRKKASSGKPRSPSPPENRASNGGLMDKEDKVSANGTGSKLRAVEVDDGSSTGKVEDQLDRIRSESATESTVKEEEPKKFDEKMPERIMNKSEEQDERVNDKSAPASAEDTSKSAAGGEIQSTENGEPRRSLSDADAALLVQSAYRGYQVRKWEPLKKLKQIRGIRDQASGIGRQIETLAFSSPMDEKKRLSIGEMIMNLLLQLDTIQGLHPSVREIRKSVANSLVILQDRMDMLTGESPQKMEETTPPGIRSEGNRDMAKGVCSNEGQSVGSSATEESTHLEGDQDHQDSPAESAIADELMHVEEEQVRHDSSVDSTAPRESKHLEEERDPENTSVGLRAKEASELLQGEHDHRGSSVESIAAEESKQLEGERDHQDPLAGPREVEEREHLEEEKVHEVSHEVSSVESAATEELKHLDAEQDHQDSSVESTAIEEHKNLEVERLHLVTSVESESSPPGNRQEQISEIAVDPSPPKSEDTTVIVPEKSHCDDPPAAASPDAVGEGRKEEEIDSGGGRVHGGGGSAGEAEQVREMLEKLLREGKEQLALMSALGARVEDLERKLARRGKLRRRSSRPLSKTTSSFVSSPSPAA